MLTEKAKYFKEIGKAYQTDIYLAVSIIFVALISFYLGRLSILWREKERITVEKAAPIYENPNSGANARKEGIGERTLPRESVVASKNGSTYHLIDCPGAKKIKTENLITFEGEAEAKAAGYRPAANCPGLQ